MKMTSALCAIAALFFVIHTNAQLTENFSDGDFTQNPLWTGIATNWTVNTSLQLQSNNTVANNSFYLSTASTTSLSAQWEFYVRLAFNTSSANYVDVYLTASSSNLSLAATTGYFVRIGSTDDDLCLYRKDGAASTKIIDGTNGILNKSNNTLKIKITRDVHGKWTLLRDISGTGNSYLTEGIAADIVYTTSAFFGIFVKQSTASFFKKHFFDDISITPFVTDTIAPKIDSVNVTGVNTLDVFFSEPVDSLSSRQTSNYFIDNNIGSPIAANRDPTDNSLVHLLFNTNFPNG
ncbi:MAG: hypothetical protein JST96_09650, partial [Bacteroidetes bacterium]|nr:hypothetical protein [Bacteroidota bacterium]